MALASGTDGFVDQITIGGALHSVGGASTGGTGQGPSFAAPKGSLYIRNDTGASTAASRLYINTGGAGNTVWTAITTAT